MILTLSTNTMPNRNIEFSNYSVINADTKAFHVTRNCPPSWEWQPHCCHSNFREFVLKITYSVDMHILSSDIKCHALATSATNT